ncbi:MAG: Gfo/Idh/MocA family oxidoreductase [Planctomycetes bacterium]|nr:Gfo/Idh/MocA family oxidoreductase [Planctomycetota bacterium]
MNAFDALTQSIDEAIGTGQIGTPVAARIVVHHDADHGLLERLAARSLEAASSWLRSRPESVAALGGAERGQITLLARFAGGQSAVAAVSSRTRGAPLMEAVVWGNRGTASWEEGAGFRDVERDRSEPELSDEAKRLLDLIRGSLASSAKAPLAKPQADARSAPSRMIAPRKPPWGVLLVAGDHTHQPNYAEALAADPRCKLVGLTDEMNVSPRRRDLNERLARRLNIPLLPDLDAALRRDDVQLVSICAEPMRRGRIIVRAAEAGKHLYLDKPLAGTLHDANEIVAAVERAGVISHMFSLTPLAPAQRMRRVVRAGELGDLSGLHFDLCFAKGHAGTAELDRPRRESAEPEEYELPDAKRELTNVGVYPLVAMLWLTGDRARRVAATTGNYFFAEHQERDMEDFGQMLLELQSGAVATISAGRAGWRSHPSSGLNRTSLIGSNDAAVFDAHRPRVAVWADVPCWAPPERDPEDPMGMWAGPKAPEYTAAPKQAWITPPAAGPAADAKHFLDCLEAGQASEVPAALGAAATEILLAGYRSASRNGEWVSLPLD